MSVDDVYILKVEVASIRAMLEERSRIAERNGKILSALVVAIVMQTFFAVFMSGSKLAVLERLTLDVAAIQQKMEGLK
jgi:hypothetical protein